MSDVLLEVRNDGVAVLTLAAAQRRNAITLAMAQDLGAACERIDANDAVGAVVLVSEGPAFCAGADRDLLRRIAADVSAEQAYRDIEQIYGAFARVSKLRPPSIAAIQGPAIGAGLNLALSTDLRIAAHDARLASGFLGLGMHPGGGHFSLVGRAGGPGTAAALGLFGIELDGREAVERGLAWESHSAELVVPRCLELAAAAAARPALARRTSQSMRLQSSANAMSADAAVQLEQAAQMWSLPRSVLGRGEAR